MPVGIGNGGMRKSRVPSCTALSRERRDREGVGGPVLEGFRGIRPLTAGWLVKRGSRHGRRNAGDDPRGVLEAVETLQRLVKQGRPREEAIRLIACVLMDEMFHVMDQGREFDRARYVSGLSRLPRLPWE